MLHTDIFRPVNNKTAAAVNRLAYGLLEHGYGLETHGLHTHCTKIPSDGKADLGCGCLLKDRKKNYF